MDIEKMTKAELITEIRGLNQIIAGLRKEVLDTAIEARDTGQLDILHWLLGNRHNGVDFEDIRLVLQVLIKGGFKVTEDSRFITWASNNAVKLLGEYSNE